MDSKSKIQIIKEVYENQEFGYGGINETYKKANAIDPTIRRVDVKNYLDKLTHRQTQFKHKGQNSFVSPQPLFEFEVDLIDMTKTAKENDGFQWCFVAIDNFTKYAWGIPMKSNKTDNCLDAFKNIIEKMGTPKQVYSDQEGAFTTTEWKELMNSLKIRHIFANSAHSIERFNRTLKQYTQTRLDAMGLERFRWTESLEPILNKYNNTKHETIEMTPNQAKKKGNLLLVSFNLWNNAKRERKNPDLKVGDSVRLQLKYAGGQKKGYMPKWSKEVYKITVIDKNAGGTVYLINKIQAQYKDNRTYNRSELLKV